MVFKVMVHGRAYSGKDTVADYLVQNYGFTRLAFADPIYVIARKVFRMKKKNRRLLQFIGQGARKIWPDVWVWLTFRKADKLISQGHKIVISDLRQENEFIAGSRRGYLAVHVDASLEQRVKRAMARDGIDPMSELNLWEHAAETGADKYCGEMYIVSNDSTLQDLHKQVDWMMVSRKFVPWFLREVMKRHPRKVK